MIDQARFERIKKSHGSYASWAVWSDAGERPKSNIGDLSIFDIEKRDTLLSQLEPNIVLVALSAASRSIQFSLGNFHDRRARYAQDYKLRYALHGTSLWGAYMTDIIKGVEQNESGKVMQYLKNNKSIEKANIESFRAELRDLGVAQPTIVALGGDAFTVLTRNLGGQDHVWKMPHYSQHISKEDYREQCLTVIELIDGQPSV